MIVTVYIQSVHGMALGKVEESGQNKNRKLHEACMNDHFNLTVDIFCFNGATNKLKKQKKTFILFFSS